MSWDYSLINTLFWSVCGEVADPTPQWNRPLATDLRSLLTLFDCRFLGLKHYFRLQFAGETWAITVPKFELIKVFLIYVLIFLLEPSSHCSVECQRSGS